MTPAAFQHMLAMGERLEDALESLLEAEGLPWNVQRVGARLEVGYSRLPPRSGRQSVAAVPPLLPEAIRLYLLNRGLVITPFHNMVLMSPVTPAAEVDRLYSAWAECIRELVAFA
jgi:glutamate-1-semialdehyde 2,1-aminomutase